MCGACFPNSGNTGPEPAKSGPGARQIWGRKMSTRLGQSWPELPQTHGPSSTHVWPRPGQTWGPDWAGIAHPWAKARPNLARQVQALERELSWSAHRATWRTHPKVSPSILPCGFRGFRAARPRLRLQMSARTLRSSGSVPGIGGCACVSSGGRSLPESGQASRHRPNMAES